MFDSTLKSEKSAILCGTYIFLDKMQPSLFEDLLYKEDKIVDGPLVGQLPT